MKGRPRFWTAAVTIVLPLISIIGPLAVTARATSAKELGSVNAATLGAGRMTGLSALCDARRAGAPFAVQETEVLDAFEAGLPISNLEADVVLSRAIYDICVAGQHPSALKAELLQAYRAHWSQHAGEIIARNATLNADAPSRLATRAPDGSRDWELYSDPALYQQLSSGSQLRLQHFFGPRGRITPAGSFSAQGPVRNEVQVAAPNILVNDPTADATNQDTQSGTALVLGSGSTILCSFNDSGSRIGGAAHLVGIARSTDGGITWADQGALPTSANGDAGYPVYARNNTTGTAILSTLSLNTTAAVPTFRTTDGGATFMAPVDADGGGQSNDRPWIACDNFAGAGQGNFYLLYRDAGAGGGMSFTRSTDGGATWSARQLLTAAVGNLAWLVVAADHAIYGFWLNGNQITFRKSTNLGINWAAPIVVTALRTSGINGDLALNGGFRTNASIQVVAHPTDASQLHMTWNDKGIAPSPDKANVYYARTTDGGTTWSSPLQINADTTTNDNFHPVLAITPDGTALFTSWYDRRLDPGNSLIDVFARHATISGASATFEPEYRITTVSFPVVRGQDPALNGSFMGDWDIAVADNANFYRTWGDNRLPNGAHAHQPDVRFTKVPKAGPGAIAAAAGSSLVAESCSPPNGAPDPGESVTMSLSVTNLGSSAPIDLVGTLQATGGVTAPGAPQSYGALAPGATAARSFTFTANGDCAGTITPTLQLQDGATNLGTVSYSSVLGVTAVIGVGSYSSGDLAVPIPAFGTAGDMDDQFINVADTGDIGDVNVRVRLNHTSDSDLTLRLIAPDSTNILLAFRRGATGDNYGSGLASCAGTTTVFDDDVATAIGSGAAPFAGSFRPETPLSALIGGRANGTWRLEINDIATVDVGTLYCWSLEITRTMPSCASPCGTTAVDERTPVSFGVWQNQPNPFRTATSIRYAIPFATSVSLAVYNVQGRRVATLVRESRQEPGVYSVSFGRSAVDASGDAIGPLPAGVYFYQLRAGAYSSARKMMLVR